VEGEMGGVALFFQAYGGTCRPGTDPRTKPSDADIGWQLATDVIAAAGDPLHHLAGPIEARLHTIDLPLRPLDPETLATAQTWTDIEREERADAVQLVERDRK